MKAELEFWGKIGTAAMLAVAVLVVWSNWCGPLKPNEWGDVAAGVAAPLAFLWLVLTFLDTNAANKELVAMERAYISCGGDFEDRLGVDYFRLDVENHGKTAAFIVGYDLQFAKLSELQPPAKVQCLRELHYRHMDGLSPQGARKMVRTDLKRNPNYDVIFGAVWYRNIFDELYYSRFILRIAPVRDIPNEGVTRLDIHDVAGEYWERDKPARPNGRRAC